MISSLGSLRTPDKASEKKRLQEKGNLAKIGGTDDRKPIGGDHGTRLRSAVVTEDLKWGKN